jgi:hypothetical protein
MKQVGSFHPGLQLRLLPTVLLLFGKKFPSVVLNHYWKMDSIHIELSPRLGLLIAAWRNFFTRLHNQSILTDNGFQYLLALLVDKLQEALDSEFHPLVLDWLKETLPKVMKCRGTVNLINQVPAHLWTSDHLFRHNYFVCLKRRASQLSIPS